MLSNGALAASDEDVYRHMLPAINSVATLDSPSKWPLDGNGNMYSGGTTAVSYVLAGDSMTWTTYMGWGMSARPTLRVLDDYYGLILSNIYSPMGSLGNTPLGMGIASGTGNLAPGNPHFTTVDWQNRTPDDRYADVTDEQTCGQISWTGVMNPYIDRLVYPDSPYPLDRPYVADFQGTDIFNAACWGALHMAVTMADMKPFSPVGTVVDGMTENPGIRIGSGWGYDLAYPGLGLDGGVMPPLAVQPYTTTDDNYYDIYTGWVSWNPTGQAVVSVLDPHLQVVKEVCTKYSEAGEPLCTNDDPDGWEPDSDGPGDVSGPAGVTAGVTAGVEQGSLPAGVTQLLWRITAVNSGNMPLTGVHVAADAMTFQPAAGSAAVQASQDDCSGMEFHDTYAAPGQPTTDVYHVTGAIPAPSPGAMGGLGLYDLAAAGEVAYGTLMPGASMSQTCTTSLSAPFTGTVQNSVGLNALFDDPDHPIFWQPDALLYTDGYASCIASGGESTFQATGPYDYSIGDSCAVDPAKTIMSRFTGFGGEQGQLASNVDSAQVVIPSSPVNNPPQTPPASSQPPALPPSPNPPSPNPSTPSNQAPAGGRVQPTGLLGAIGAVGAGLLISGVLVYRRQRPLFHTRGSRAG